MIQHSNKDLVTIFRILKMTARSLQVQFEILNNRAKELKYTKQDKYNEDVDDDFFLNHIDPSFLS